jgi:formylglycine-generating enzyme required for sulfatase activity
MPDSRPLRVFLCHASQDKPAVRDLYTRLKAEAWIDPWLDEERLLPGMDWNLEIYKALRDADAIIVCLSRESVAKEGYVQKEFKRALSFAEEKPEGTIYIIPLRLNDCQPPMKFQQRQWVDYFTAGAYEKLLKSLRLRFDGLRPKAETQKPENPNFFQYPYRETKYTPSGHKVFEFGEMEFVKVPAGEFSMGSDTANSFATELEFPKHKLIIPYDYFISRFLITNYRFAKFIVATNYKSVSISRDDDFPVVNVAWYDAYSYVDWLTQSLLKNTRWCFCIPSEAEWEKAARGTFGNEWPWGDDFDIWRCNSLESKKYASTRVGSYAPLGDSPYGASDMAGNVWEWTRSLYMDASNKSRYKYPYKINDGRENEKAESSRILRGGSFNETNIKARCSYRYKMPPDYQNNDIGFRVVIIPAP